MQQLENHPLFPAGKKICDLFGGPCRLAQTLKTKNAKLAPDRSTVYRWFYPPPRGLGGWIPPKYWTLIIAAGIEEGIYLAEEDFLPPGVPLSLWQKMRETLKTA